MSDTIGPFDSFQGSDPNEEGAQDPGTTSEQVKLRNVGARVPQDVGKGVFATGAIVMTGQTEFVIDFVQRMQRPHHIIARVVVPHAVMGRTIQALEQNIDKYKGNFGEPKELPKPPKDAPRQSIKDVYDDMKLPDEMLSGTYANGVLIGHSAAEFSFDFITNFFPHSAVSCRVYMSASHVPQMLDSLKNSFGQLQQRVAQAQAQAQAQANALNQQRQQLEGDAGNDSTPPADDPHQPDESDPDAQSN